MNNALNRARIIFDLNGYYIVRGLLSAEEVKDALQAIDAHKHEFVERIEGLRNTTQDSSKELAGDGRTGRFDLGGMLAWPEGNRIFRRLLHHSRLVPYLKLLLGEGYRLDHSPLLLRQKYGSEGFSLHGGPLTSDGKMDRALQYQCVSQEIHNSLVAVAFQLVDHEPGDGGFCVVKGSHKLNFPLTKDMMEGTDTDFFVNHVNQPVTKAGDCLIFSEATIHGSLAWNNRSKERLVALYRFSPATYAYARGYLGWPKEYLEGMTEEELAVMQPPFNTRFDRQLLRDDGSLGECSSRPKEKKEFDKKVFKENYF